MMIDFINRKLLDIYREVNIKSDWSYDDWLERKMELNDLIMNGKSKVSFDIDVVKNNETVKKEIEDMMFALDYNYGLRNDLKTYMSNFIYNCLGNESIAEAIKNNRATKKIVGKSEEYQKGMKLTKIFIKEFSTIIHEELLKDFQKKYSMIIQGVHIKDTVYISTLPEDIITMSDNTNSWSSCMSTDSSYTYRMGVVEYMQSPRVAIAYTKSRTELAPGVDNKKWRALIMVNKAYSYNSIDDKDYMTLNIKKPYPYNSQATVEKLKDFLIASIDLPVIDDEQYGNDIGVLHEDFYQAYVDSTYENICFLLEDKGVVNMLNYDLGYECPFCGYSGTCGCLDDLNHCSQCGNFVNDDDSMYIEGYDFVCRDCFEEDFFFCSDCEEGTHLDDGVETADGRLICGWCAERDYVTCEDCGDVIPEYEAVNGLCSICEENRIRESIEYREV